MLLDQRAALDRYADQHEDQDISLPAYDAFIRHCLASVVEKDRRVLCLRAGTGRYLDSVRPSLGVGMDISKRFVELARRRFPQYEFLQMDEEPPVGEEPFDWIIIPDAVDAFFDLGTVLRSIRRVCHTRTRILCIWPSPLWRPVIDYAVAVGKMPPRPQAHGLILEDVENIFRLHGFEIFKQIRGVLFPFQAPLLTRLANGVLANLPLVNRIGMGQALIAGPVDIPAYAPDSAPSISVIVLCKDERGTVEEIVESMPNWGPDAEILFCNDRSTDGTADEVLRLQARRPEKNIRLVEGPGISKAENLRAGLAEARGDILIFMDGDATVPPEELPLFVDVLRRKQAALASGTRLVYQMRPGAMETSNRIGNRMFALLYSWLIGRRITDTLCGTRALWRSDYERICELRDTDEVHDPWGDQETIMGAARLGLRQIEVPVHYRERIYGDTKMVGRLDQALLMFRYWFNAIRRLR